MPKSKAEAEAERAYYNKKLIREGMEEELKKSVSWKQFLQDFMQFVIGNLIGRVLIEKIGTDTLIPNKPVRFIAEVLILATMIMLVHIVIEDVKKMMRRE